MSSVSCSDSYSATEISMTSARPLRVIVKWSCSRATRSASLAIRAFASVIGMVSIETSIQTGHYYDHIRIRVSLPGPQRGPPARPHSSGCRLRPLCRVHHQAKQAPGWHLSQPQPGVLTWTTPHGREYTVPAGADLV